MNYIECVKIIEKGDNILAMNDAIKELESLAANEEDKAIKGNFNNWIKIANARISPNKLSRAFHRDEDGLQRQLFENPASIELGLTPICREFDLKIGRVDILCRDQQGQYVLVEIKDGRAIGQVIGQTISYLFAFEAYLGKKPRAIIVAPSFHPQCLVALEYLRRNNVNDIKLKYLNGGFVEFDAEKFKKTNYRKLAIYQEKLWREIADK